MAQFTAQGRLKLLFNSDGVHCKLVGNGSVKGFSSFQLQKGKLVRFICCSSSGRDIRVLRNGCSRNKPMKLHVTTASVSVGGESDDEYDSELDDDDLACFRGLVLDISYRPINVVCWRRAICLEFLEKADVLEYYDQTVDSPNGSYYIPAVLRIPHLLQVVKRRRVSNNLSRKNILYRDGYTCQYCPSTENLTIDHVVPTSRGGEWKWENLVTACSKCNSKKGQKTVEEANMKLKKVPKAPKDYDILAIPLTSQALRMLRTRKGTPEEWRQYLGRPSSEPRPQG